MSSAPRPFTPQRIERLLLRSRLWLLRLAEAIVILAGLCAPLERALHQAAHRHLDRHARMICALIGVKALPLIKLPAPRVGGKPRRMNRAHFHRTLFGSRLRKRSRASDPRTRIAALFKLIENFESEVQRFARRLRNGLTRRLGAHLESIAHGGAPRTCDAPFACAVRDSS